MEVEVAVEVVVEVVVEVDVDFLLDFLVAGIVSQSILTSHRLSLLSLTHSRHTPGVTPKRRGRDHLSPLPRSLESRHHLQSPSGRLDSEIEAVTSKIRRFHNDVVQTPQVVLVSRVQWLDLVIVPVLAWLDPTGPKS